MNNRGSSFALTKRDRERLERHDYFRRYRRPSPGSAAGRGHRRRFRAGPGRLRPCAAGVEPGCGRATRSCRSGRVGCRCSPGGPIRPLTGDADRPTGHRSRLRTARAVGGAILLRTVRMRDVRIDPVTRTARAEAGSLWQDVTVPAAGHGLAALAGTSANVGVTGYTLGGGLGWLARRYGLAANSVTAAELVTPDGDLVRADTGHESELFWAIRGGGGGVGVVTALEMRLYPVRELYAGVLFFPLQRSAEVLHTWRVWTGTVPDDVTS